MSDLTLRDNLIRVAYAAGPDVRPRLLQALTSAAMPEPEFWKIVDSIGWGTKTTDYKAVKRDLLRNQSPNQLASFRTTLEVLRGRLYKALTKWEEDEERAWLPGGGRSPKTREIGLGDDGFSDFLHHIIGLGKREYEANLKNPELAQKRARAYDFVESFAYGIPYAGDYKLLDSEHYRQRGKDILEMVEWLYSRPEAKDVKDAVGVLYKGLEGMVHQYKTRDFVAQEFAIIGAAKAVQTWWDKQGRGYGPDAAKWAKFTESMPPKVTYPGHIFGAVQNLVHDTKDFLLD